MQDNVALSIYVNIFVLSNIEIDTTKLNGEDTICTQMTVTVKQDKPIC